MLEKLVKNYMSNLLNININTKKSGPVAKHFNEICPNKDFLTITPLEHVQRKIPDTFMGYLDRVDILALLQREQYWIKKTKNNCSIWIKTEKRNPQTYSICSTI